MFQGTINELHLLSKPKIEIEVDKPERAIEFLKESGYDDISTANQKILLPFLSSTDTGKLNTLLVKNGFTVSSLSIQRKDLENLFLDITRNN